MAGFVEFQRPAITHTFVYKALWKKLHVRQCVRLVKDIDEGCAWCGAQETDYHFVKSCPMVPLLYGCGCGCECGPVGGRQPHDIPHPPNGLVCVVGLHRLWT